ncbi:MAG: polysaccharide biosynthesis protein [Balneola sp.]|nr:MAG: polysaccharide biosynthesis protein [Balneola sp.]
MSNNSLKQKTMVVVFSRILTSLIDLTTAVIVVRVLGKTEYAILGYLLMIYEVARNLATLGFPESVFYYFEHLAKNFRKAFALQTTGLLVLTGLLAGGVIMIVQLFAPELISGFDKTAIIAIQSLLPFIAIMAVFEIPTWPVHNILLALDRQKEAGWYQILTSLISFLALIVPISLGYSIEVAIYSLVGYAIIRFIGSMIWMLLVIPPGEIRTPSGNLKEQVYFSIPLGISSLVNQFNKYADKFIVAFFLTDVAFAEYSVGAQEVPIIKVIPFAVGTVLISRYVQLKIKGSFNELIHIWHKGINKVALVVIPLTILAVVLAPYFINIFETDETSYRNAIIPFQIYNLIILIRVAHYGSILQAFGDTKGVLRLSILLVVLNILFSIPLTYFYGINGTAFGTLLANIINWVFLLRRIGTHLNIPAYKVLPLPQYGRITLVSIIVGAMTYFLSNSLDTYVEWIPNILISSAFFLTGYSLLGSVTKTIKKEDWNNVKEMMKLSFLWK